MHSWSSCHLDRSNSAVFNVLVQVHHNCSPYYAKNVRMQSLSQMLTTRWLFYLSCSGIYYLNSVNVNSIFYKGCRTKVLKAFHGYYCEMIFWPILEERMPVHVFFLSNTTKWEAIRFLYRKSKKIREWVGEESYIAKTGEKPEAIPGEHIIVQDHSLVRFLWKSPSNLISYFMLYPEGRRHICDFSGNGSVYYSCDNSWYKENYVFQIWSQAAGRHSVNTHKCVKDWGKQTCLGQQVLLRTRFTFKARLSTLNSHPRLLITSLRIFFWQWFTCVCVMDNKIIFHYCGEGSITISLDAS